MKTVTQYHYTEGEEEQRKNAIEILKMLEADYRKNAEPYLKILAQIDMAARQTIIMIPETDYP